MLRVAIDLLPAGPPHRGIARVGLLEVDDVTDLHAHERHVTVYRATYRDTDGEPTVVIFGNTDRPTVAPMAIVAKAVQLISRRRGWTTPDPGIVSVVIHPS